MLDPVLRRRIIDLYRRRCALCDASGYASGLDVHHIQPKGLGGSKLLDVPENLIALCRDCHEDVHRQRPRWTRRLLPMAARMVETRWHLVAP